MTCARVLKNGSLAFNSLWVYFFILFFFHLLNAFSLIKNPSWVALGVYNNKIFSCVFSFTSLSHFFFRQKSTFHCFWVEFTWLDYVRHLFFFMCKTHIFLFIDFNSNDWPSVTYRCTLVRQMIRLKIEIKWIRQHQGASKHWTHLIVNKTICTIDSDCIRPIYWQQCTFRSKYSDSINHLPQ